MQKISPMLYLLTIAIALHVTPPKDTLPATVIIPASDFLDDQPKGNIIVNAGEQHVNWLFNNTAIVLNSETNLLKRVTIPEDGSYHLFVRSTGHTGSSFRVSVNNTVTNAAFGDTVLSWKEGGEFKLKKGITDLKITRIDPGSVVDVLVLSKNASLKEEDIVPFQLAKEVQLLKEYKIPSSIQLASGLVRVLAGAEERGLHPADYDAARLSVRFTAINDSSRPRTAVQVARLDVALTANVLRFAHALRFGRIRPTAVHAALYLPQDTMNMPAFVRMLAAQTQQPSTHDTATLDAWVETQFDALEPPWTHYWLLRHTLHQYHMLATDTVPLPSGLTRSLLNHRIQQIELSLERWRWLPHAFTAPPIFINIPAFRLYAFGRPTDDEESTLLSMKVAVGHAFRRRTPVFSATLRTVIFAPYWDVPQSIALAEVVPKARHDPTYLMRSHMDILSLHTGRPLPLTASSLAQVIAGTARIRQRPGADNALGEVKFIFPNSYDVYLHDTPVRSTFAAARRDVSHGCIRVAEAARLAAFVLRYQAEWTTARIDSAMQGAKPLSVTLTRPIPVFIVYTTVITRANGQPFFYDDIYGHDRTLASRLARGYPYH